MKANELIIGDWIVHRAYLNGTDNPPFEYSTQIKNIYGNYINCYTENHTIISGTFLETCYPIPLTKEILEKNGWIRPFNHDNIYGYTLNNEHEDVVFYVFSNKHIRMNIECDNSVDIRCEYVHELQHALRLCGLSDLANNFKIT